MSTKSKLFKLKNSKKEKHHKGKTKTKKRLSNVGSRLEPYVITKGSNALFNANINSFWKYSPTTPFPVKKNEKSDFSDNITISSTSTFFKSRHKLPSSFSSNSSAGNMSSIVSRRENDNTAAVIEARREIEKIKTELETLINANIKTQSFYTENVNSIPPDIEALLNTAADACKSLTDEPENPEIINATTSTKPVIKSSPALQRKKMTQTPIEETSIEPPQAQAQPQQPQQKSRPYDPEKTREFIKKQKLRRKEKLLEEEQKKQENENARKNKLEELKKKTLELVANNLKKSNKKGVKSPSDVNTNNTSKLNAQVDNNNKTVNKFILQSKRCRARSFDNVSGDKDNDNKRSRSVSREIVRKKTDRKIPENNQSLITTKSQVTFRSSSQQSLTPKINKTSKKPLKKIEIEPINVSPKISEISTKINNQTKQKIETTKNQIVIEPINVSPKNSEISTKINIETKPPINVIKPVDVTSEKITKQENKIEDEYESEAAKELIEIKQKLETSITQLKDKHEHPVWLQPAASVPYPYNFISAVRKKLEYVTQKQPNNKIDKNVENNKLNVSIQCSIDKKILDVNSVNIPKLISPDKLESPRCRTYESHKCRRQLYSSRKKNSNDSIKINKSESDSDTTKNIPEIPHEDLIQPMKNSMINDNSSKINLNSNNTLTSNISLSSNISDKLKNITFERNIPTILHIGDIKLPEPKKYAELILPDDKIEIPKQNNRKSRSKYPDDIDSILSHYSKIKSEQNSYSDDFNSASGSGSSKLEKTESVTEYIQIKIPDLSKSASISEHLPHMYSNSSSKENIFEDTHETLNKQEEKKNASTTVLSEITSGNESSKNRTVSTETNLTMKDVPSLSKQSDDSIIEAATIKTTEKTDSSIVRTLHSSSLKKNDEEDLPQVKKLTKPEVFLKRRADEIESLFDVPSTSTNFNPINCRRGCNFPENKKTDSIIQNNNTTTMKNISDIDSICSQDLATSNIIDRSSISTIATNSIISRREENLDLKSHPYVAISLDMVDQMIKDEDVRLEHLKAVLKLRDQALFDRIKGELALLEIKKRELREYGRTIDITAIKKKQRGLIIKLQQERHEMHRLKTAHKQAAKARKSALHEQKSIIKTQLSSTDQIPKKLRRLSHLERPSLGPVKVYRVDSKTEVSETTLSRKGSDDSITLTTNSSVVTQISEKISVEKSEIYYSDSLTIEPKQQQQQQQQQKSKTSSSVHSEKLKRSLLMKEAEIDKRRKEIEELMKWQKRLKEKEAEVVELERQAVKSLQSDDQDNVRVFTGAHLNKVWKGFALPEKNFDEHKKYQMSKRSLDKFYQNARKMFKEVSDQDQEKRSKSESYSSEFEQTHSTSLNVNNIVIPIVDSDLIISNQVQSDKSSIHSSTQDVSSIQQDDKSVSVSESESFKTEVNTLVKSDSKIQSIQSEFIDSLQNKSSAKSLELIIATDSLEKTPSISATDETSKYKNTQSQILEHLLDSLNTSIKSDSLNTSLPKTISEASEKPESHILEVADKSEPQTSLNIDSLNSSIKSELKESPKKSEVQISENIESPNSSAKSEINSYDSEFISEVEQVAEESKSEIAELETPEIISNESKVEVEIPENVESHISSSKSEIISPQVEEKSTTKSELDESPEQSATETQEISEESNKIECWEPQVISEIKSDSSTNNNEHTIKSELEVAPEEPDTKSKTNSETHISEQNLQIDTTPTTTTPRSEFQYETDFDKYSESDQSKIESEVNVSLKETNVDDSDHSPTTSIQSKEETDTVEAETSNKISSESSGVSNTIKVSPKDPEIVEHDLDDGDLSDSKKGVSHIDVRKRVSEILADANANGPRGDKSPRVQDLYTTTYDITGSSESTPDSGSPTNELNKQEKVQPYINEAEELLRKQLEIEQEIKRLERQQQNIPYLFMREIPNKPPPPYKPPDFPLTPIIASIIPSKPEQTKKMINEATGILYGAYTSGDLTKTTWKTKDDQQRFMFDLCKEIAIEVCKPIIDMKIPSWRSDKNKFQSLFARRPITRDYLNSVLNRKVLQLLNFEPITRNDSLIIRWSRKKRDHVDEILVSETQAEEAEWTNFDSDEEIIKENLTQSILDLLIVDAANDVNNIFMKKKHFHWVDC